MPQIIACKRLFSECNIKKIKNICTKFAALQKAPLCLHIVQYFSLFRFFYGGKNFIKIVQGLLSFTSKWRVRAQGWLLHLRFGGITSINALQSHFCVLSGAKYSRAWTECGKLKAHSRLVWTNNCQCNCNNIFVSQFRADIFRNFYSLLHHKTSLEAFFARNYLIRNRRRKKVSLNFSFFCGIFLP